jgi:hypothetical protein
LFAAGSVVDRRAVSLWQRVGSLLLSPPSMSVIHSCRMSWFRSDGLNTQGVVQLCSLASGLSATLGMTMMSHEIEQPSCRRVEACSLYTAAVFSCNIVCKTAVSCLNEEIFARSLRSRAYCSSVNTVQNTNSFRVLSFNVSIL